MVEKDIDAIKDLLPFSSTESTVVSQPSRNITFAHFDKIIENQNRVLKKQMSTLPPTTTTVTLSSLASLSKSQHELIIETSKSHKDVKQSVIYKELETIANAIQSSSIFLSGFLPFLLEIQRHLLEQKRSQRIQRNCSKTRVTFPLNCFRCCRFQRRPN